MNRFSYICLKTVRWSSAPLLLVIACFLTTGYMITGEIMLGGIDEKQALALHKLLHYPLILLVAVHTIPATYLAVRRWGWFGQRKAGAAREPATVEDLQKTP